MKKIVAALLALFAFLPVVSAQIIFERPTPNSLSAHQSGVQIELGANVVQDFETFALGSGIQNGWTGFNGGAGVGFNIENTGIAGFGTRTARHYSDGSAFAGFEMNSPVAAIATGVLAGDVIISAANANLYQFVTVGNGNFFNTRLNFESNGTIRALTVDPACTTGTFVNTLGTWTPNVKMRIAIEVPGGAPGILRVYKDGAVIFSGTDIPWTCTGASQGIQQYETYSANASGTAGTNYMIDNINSNLPEPGTLGLLAFGALALVRRKR